jgi:hypothetical protein
VCEPRREARSAGSLAAPPTGPTSASNQALRYEDCAAKLGACNAERNYWISETQKIRPAAHALDRIGIRWFPLSKACLWSRPHALGPRIPDDDRPRRHIVIWRRSRGPGESCSVHRPVRSGLIAGNKQGRDPERLEPICHLQSIRVGGERGVTSTRMLELILDRPENSQEKVCRAPRRPARRVLCSAVTRP